MRWGFALGLCLGLLACEEPDKPTRPADFTVRTGVESVTVLDAPPNIPLTLYNPENKPLVTMMTDELGQAHFAYVPEEHIVLDPSNFEEVSLANGKVLAPGENYYIQDDTTTPPLWSATFAVRDVHDVAPAQAYAQQTLVGVHHSPLTGVEGDPEDGFQYLTMRDGASLSAMVRFPDEYIYGPGPYPTVVEYSGYSPSRPNRMDSGTLIANALGYATVSVNMRGTGCSGGVFDVFNRAQHADGYDVVEIVASQPWVMNNQVGMVGLSYPGISQLYVASTRPPSLAAIVPLSTIADAWEMQWPGGIYNKGFTRQWVEEREAQSKEGGASWVVDRIANGDTTCEENLKLSSHSVDFETFLRGMDVRPEAADDRNLTLLVSDITCPVFFGGSFQDEQTGAQFGNMLDQFMLADTLKIQISNGRHPDGFAPHSVFHWFEFLEFYVAERIPELHPLLRSFGAAEFGTSFGMETANFEEDRFTSYPSYEDALAEYESEPTVRLLFELGAGSDQAGSPVPRFETTYDTWPPDARENITWYLAEEGQMLPELSDTEGANAWSFDPDASEVNFFGPKGYQLLEPLWDIDWTRFEEGHIAAFETLPFEEDTVISGPGYLDVWVHTPVEEVMVQVTLTEVRPDDNEMLIQTGWLNLAHRAFIEGEDLRLKRSHSAEDYQPMPIDTWEPARVQIPTFAHPMRAGSILRIAITSPGRDHGTWQFETPEYDENPAFLVGFGGSHSSALSLGVLPEIEIPESYPPCPGLRGQPCRTYQPAPNTPAD